VEQVVNQSEQEEDPISSFQVPYPSYEAVAEEVEEEEGA
jgi:hypothetical protein